MGLGHFPVPLPCRMRVEFRAALGKHVGRRGRARAGVHAAGRGRVARVALGQQGCNKVHGMFFCARIVLEAHARGTHRGLGLAVLYAWNWAGRDVRVQIGTVGSALRAACARGRAVRREDQPFASGSRFFFCRERL